MNAEKNNSSKEALGELINVVAQLRDPKEGCPWDLEQTHDSLIPYVLEEANEVADAIRHGDDNHLCEELGDLLLQVVLHSQLAYEQKRFCLTDIIKGISKKLIRRHPHVFANEIAIDSNAVKAKWNAIKEAEHPKTQSKSPLSDRLRKKARSQSALSAAMYISQKTAKVGFEWESLDGVWEKVHEELEEFKEALNQKDFNNAQRELGDVLFSLVNVARWCKLSPEEGLAGTNKRFLDRFRYIELALEGKVAEHTLSELKKQWKLAKANLTNSPETIKER